MTTNSAEQLAFDMPVDIEQPAAPNLDEYAGFICFTSGGKDSTAAVLQLLKMGVPAEKIELHHHLVDGAPGDAGYDGGMMDWPVTEAYCRAFAKAFGLKLYMSWREGGFEREMLRDNDRTAPIKFETPEGTVEQRGGERGPLGTRRKFPQVSANLSVRYCSSAVKIDPGSTMITNSPRFNRGEKFLVVTGERAEESSARAKYQQFEPHRSDNRFGKRVRRHIDHWRPVHGWSEQEVWNIMEEFKVRAHPAYEIGWGRASCALCIFSSKSAWASIQKIAPEMFEKVARYEEEFGVTIQRKLSIRQLAALGTPYEMDPELVKLALGTDYPVDIITENWALPAGAFGESCGPT